MKSIIKTICILYLIIFVGCNNKQNQSASSKTVNSREGIQSNGSIISDKIRNIEKNELAHNELYSKGETLRETITKLISDSSTMKKLITESLSDSQREITLFYQKTRIVSIVDRFTNKKNEVIKNSVFNFDESNNCISNTKRDKNNDMDITYALYGGSIIKYDVNYNQIKIDDPQKQQIIQSTKASLDSIMQHFPEFKYSFNWN